MSKCIYCSCDEDEIKPNKFQPICDCQDYDMPDDESGVPSNAQQWQERINIEKNWYDKLVNWVNHTINLEASNDGCNHFVKDSLFLKYQPIWSRKQVRVYLNWEESDYDTERRQAKYLSRGLQLVLNIPKNIININILPKYNYDEFKESNYRAAWQNAEEEGVGVRLEYRKTNLSTMCHKFLTRDENYNEAFKQIKKQWHFNMIEGIK